VISARVWWISDVSEELPLVRTPALVLHPRDFIWLRPAESMKVASSIAGARFVSLDGILPLGDATEAMTAIDAFVSDLPALETPQATGRQGVHRLDSRLSVRENQVLRLIGEGKSNKEIAAELTLSVRTVERHVSSVYAKTGIHGRVAAATLALARTPS
jgi:DNA-binding NarL/FixJ family response regulator